jgi:predicted amidophosphoribosyltransferase
MVKIKPAKIRGKWREGYVLDYHTIRSDLIGYDEYGHPIFETKRTELGELLFRLKYRSDKSVIESITETAADFINSWNPGFARILPVPPSRSRRMFQPVIEVAKALADRLNLALCVNCITKVRATPELKNVYDYSQRMKLLGDAYDADTSKLGDQSILLFDDLYRSGATLNAITDIIYTKGKAAGVYALALTRTKSTS